MKKIHKRRQWKKMVMDNKRNTLFNQRAIYDATQFQKWYAKAGGIIENEDFEKVLEKFKN